MEMQRKYQPQEPFAISTAAGEFAEGGVDVGDVRRPGIQLFREGCGAKGSKNILPWTRPDTEAAAGTLPSVSCVHAPGSPQEL